MLPGALAETPKYPKKKEAIAGQWKTAVYNEKGRIHQQAARPSTKILISS